MPAVRQNRSKLAPTCCQASSTIAAGTTPAGVVDFFMALLSFADSAPRAYRLKAGNAYLTFSTSTGTSPFLATYSQHLNSAGFGLLVLSSASYVDKEIARKVALLAREERAVLLNSRLAPLKVGEVLMDQTWLRYLLQEGGIKERADDDY